jgi:hypothetical protein
VNAAALSCRRAVSNSVLRRPTPRSVSARSFRHRRQSPMVTAKPMATRIPCASSARIRCCVDRLCRYGLQARLASHQGMQSSPLVRARRSVPWRCSAGLGQPCHTLALTLSNQPWRPRLPGCQGLICAGRLIQRASAVIPCYNAHTIRDTLDSIFAQTVQRRDC